MISLSKIPFIHKERSNHGIVVLSLNKSNLHHIINESVFTRLVLIEDLLLLVANIKVLFVNSKALLLLKNIKVLDNNAVSDLDMENPLPFGAVVHFNELENNNVICFLFKGKKIREIRFAVAR